MRTNLRVMATPPNTEFVVPLPVEIQNQMNLQLDVTKFYLWGKVISKRPVHCQILFTVMNGKWDSPAGLQITEFDHCNGIFLFTFERRAQQVLIYRRSPWIFKKSLLVFKLFLNTVPPHVDEFFQAPLSVQLHGIPHAALAARLGLAQHVSIHNLQGKVSNYAKVTVEMNLKLPLPSSLFLSDGHGVSIQIYLRYENLPAFCNYCLILGHTEDECEIKVEEELNFASLRPSIGAQLRAPSSTSFMYADSSKSEDWTNANLIPDLTNLKVTDFLVGQSQKKTLEDETPAINVPTHKPLFPQLEHGNSITWESVPTEQRRQHLDQQGANLQSISLPMNAACAPFHGMRFGESLAVLS